MSDHENIEGESDSERDDWGEGLHQAHDKLFGTTFETPENTAALLKAKLPAALVAAFNWGSLRLRPGSFVAPDFRRAHTDLLFSVELDGRDALVYILFEHQSTRNPRLHLRLVHYMHCIWTRLESEYPWPAKLPPILPVVLSQNAVRWDVPERLSELLDIPEGLAEPLRPFVPDFVYHHIQLAGMDYESIPGTSAGVFVLRAMKAERLGELLADPVWDEALIVDAPPQIMEMVLRYIIGGEVDRRAFEARIKKIANPEIRSRAMTLAQVYRQEGRKEGRQEGILEALGIRFGSVPEGLAEAVRMVEDDDRLRALHRDAIACATLEEFSAGL
jgi:hypothetical protein